MAVPPAGVACAVEVTFVSFEQCLLERMEPQPEPAHAAPDGRVVLGDTGILGVCAALHLVRRLYDCRRQQKSVEI